MAESCPGTTYAKLSWLQAWHIRDETYSSGLAELVNAQFRQPFAAYWGDGTTSASDCQNFRAVGRGQAAGQVNLKYGQEPAVQFYTHISDQYAPFHTKVINATVRDATVHRKADVAGAAPQWPQRPTSGRINDAWVTVTGRLQPEEPAKASVRTPKADIQNTSGNLIDPHTGGIGS